MLPLDTVHDLYRQMEWADARMWDAILTAPDEHGPELVERLYHIHFTQRAFLQVWKGERFEPYDPSRFGTRTELYEWAMSYYPIVSGYLSELDAGRLPTPLAAPWAKLYVHQIGGPPSGTTLGETIFQVWAHTTAHRAQIGTRLRQFGVEPPLVDYIAWIWAGRPQPRWTVDRR